MAADARQRFSYDLERPWDRRGESELCNRLFEQIVHQWQQERSDASLTTVQASIVLGITMGGSCEDKLGTTFIEFGCRLALQIGIHTRHPECFAPDPIYDTYQLEKAHKAIACGIYDYYGFALHP